MKTKSMKRTLGALLVTVMAASTFAIRADDSTGKPRLDAWADETIANFKNADPTLASFFEKAEGYAVLPKVGEGGFIFGGQRGDGVVYQKKNLIGKVELKEFSFGAQVGGGTFSEIIFFETEQAIQRFKAGQWKTAARVKATVAASGAGKTAKYDLGVAVFTLPLNGAMAAATIGGQKLEFSPLNLK